jgi:2-keto-4-pentenoate hydratase
MSSQPGPNIDTLALAQELLSAYISGAPIATPPSARDADFNLESAYAVEAEFMRARIAAGHKAVGLKVGYANRAMWRILKLETLVWAHMYDDTVHYASGTAAELALPPHRSPKIEPEIVFKLRRPLSTDSADASMALEQVEWIAVGFEIIDCPFPDWRFKPADFVAAFGLHLGLVVGEPLEVTPNRIPTLVENLANFKLRVSKDGQFVEEGSGKNSLGNPALCLAQLGGAVLRQPRATPLATGDLVSSGTLTAGHRVARGEIWQVDLDGLPASNLKLRVT